MVLRPNHCHKSSTLAYNLVTKGKIKLKKFILYAYYLVVYDFSMEDIARGSQTWSPTCELFAIAPITRQIPIIVIISSLINGANENTVA